MAKDKDLSEAHKPFKSTSKVFGNSFFFRFGKSGHKFDSVYAGF